MTDILGGGPEPAPDHDPRPRHRFFAEPMTVALTAFPLAVLTLLDPKVLHGYLYTIGFASRSDAGLQFVSDDQAKAHTALPGYVVAAPILTAAFCLVPLLLARWGLRRTVGEDPAWVPSMLRAAIALSMLSLVLHGAFAVIVATQVDGSPGGFYGLLNLIL